MVTTIQLNDLMAEPIKYHWNTNVFEVCPDCVRGHEQRFCNGKTMVSFKICDKHHGTSHTSDGRTTYDEDALKEIRRVIHLIHSPVLGSEAEREAAVIATQIISPKPQNSWTPKAEKAFPRIAYEHMPGCARSPDPDTVVISPAATQLMDKAAEDRFNEIRQQMVVDPLCYDNDVLDLEQVRLSNCVNASPTTKQTYTLRCNGEYRNDLDDVLTVDPEATNGVAPSIHGYAVLDIDGVNDESRATFDTNGIPLPIPVSFTYRSLKFVIGMAEQGKTTEQALIMNCWLRIRCAKRAEAERQRQLGLDDQEDEDEG
ncbi:hypothetical protein B0A52_01035 [Exophiala mesophila]|uniref:Uncharacterized protein n=1 Tax=Exophiala mesophila TaxID=212818 RepID=A0A438NGA5_EXOME|nr:hypothetical protein B0A52_01035 [Exophiala mesophila]